VCACEGSYVCSKCEGTPFSPHYEADAHEPLDEPAFAELAAEPFRESWQGWI
jgi:hypothetical protein